MIALFSFEFWNKDTIKLTEIFFRARLRMGKDYNNFYNLSFLVFVLLYL